MIVSEFDFNSWFQFDNNNRVILIKNRKTYYYLINFIKQVEKEIAKEKKQRTLNNDEIKQFNSLTKVLFLLKQKVLQTSKFFISLEERQTIVATILLQKFAIQSFISKSLINNSSVIKQEYFDWRDKKISSLQKFLGFSSSVYITLFIIAYSKIAFRFFMLEFYKKRMKILIILEKLFI